MDSWTYIPRWNDGVHEKWLRELGDDAYWPSEIMIWRNVSRMISLATIWHGPGGYYWLDAMAWPVSRTVAFSRWPIIAQYCPIIVNEHGNIHSHVHVRTALYLSECLTADWYSDTSISENVSAHLLHESCLARHHRNSFAWIVLFNQRSLVSKQPEADLICW